MISPPRPPRPRARTVQYTLTSDFVAWASSPPDPGPRPAQAPTPALVDSVVVYPSHRTLIAFDIVGFSTRDNRTQLHVHTRMYEQLRSAFNDVGIAWDGRTVYDRGDGALIVAAPDLTPAPFLDLLIPRLRAGLRHYNDMASEAARIRLRMSIHAGHVQFAPGENPIGEDVNHVCRLVEAPEFKRALAAAPTHLAVLASAQVYETVIRHGYGQIEPESYRPLDIECKETRTRAWLNHPSPTVSLVRDQIA